MKTVLIQRVSENAKRVETNYVIWILSVASVILFILTIDSIAITELEPYGFYYFRTLPAFFWAGIGTTIAATVISLVKFMANVMTIATASQPRLDPFDDIAFSSDRKNTR